MNNDLHNWMARNSIYGNAATELLSILDPMFGVTLLPSGSNSEAAVQAECRAIAPRYGGSLWRNNNGAAQVIEDDGQTRFIRFGLGNDSTKLNKVWKSSDAIGITKVYSEYVGQPFGVFTAVEFKEPGWKNPRTKRELAQAAFLTTVRSKGGIGIFAQSTADYEGIFK